MDDSAVSYDLAFWEGQEPRDDQEAAKTFAEIWGALEESTHTRPVAPAIQSLVRQLEARWPREDQDSPWASFPLEGDADGGTLYVNLVFGRPDEDLQFMASVARELGVVCFDPQLEVVLKPGDSGVGLPEEDPAAPREVGDGPRSRDDGVREPTAAWSGEHVNQVSQVLADLGLEDMPRWEAWVTVLVFEAVEGDADAQRL